MILEVVKLITSGFIGVGVGAVATNTIKAVTPESTSKLIKVCIWAGTAFVATAASAVASQTYDARMDAVITIAKTLKKKLKKEPEIVEEAK